MDESIADYESGERELNKSKHSVGKKFFVVAVVAVIHCVSNGICSYKLRLTN